MGDDSTVEEVLVSYRKAASMAKGLVPQLTATVERLEHHVRWREDVAARVQAAGVDDGYHDGGSPNSDRA